MKGRGSANMVGENGYGLMNEKGLSRSGGSQSRSAK